ncbi:hypothetical protein AGOR_G00225150 [Albula goreensis]|uniref:Zinc-binding protein A33-like n=1 Tax=Albula goreensis TaxID=1534307 RepID=A0A8T3CMD2_9TELE|nr:hypothetical protein AGOR_G00225150 [Albula goreensis]
MGVTPRDTALAQREGERERGGKKGGMASRHGNALEDELCCPVCGHILREPVVLSCTHRFCKACLEGSWGPNGASRECPLCCRRSSLDQLLVSAVLERACQALRTEKRLRDPEACGQHGEKLTLFCLDELLPVCDACQYTPNHKAHRLYRLEEAAQDCKEELKNALVPLQEKLNLFNKTKLNYDLTADHIKSQAKHTERQIQEEFEKLHKFLREEEEARIAILKKEEADKSEMIQQKMGGMDKEIAYITNSIRDIKQELRSEDIAFLQNYRATITRTWNTVKDPEMASGALIDVAKHLGNLKYSIWEKMQEIIQYTPVTLDPNTSADCFMVSEDLTVVQSYKERFRLPDNPERFDISAEMLGSEGFSSGRHSWEVDVRGNTYWVIGIAKDSINRKGKHVLTPAEGFWTIRLRNGEYKACSAPWLPLNMAREPEVIRITLDMDRGKVSFHDPRERVPLFTFTDIISPRVFPYFCTACKLHPLRILPRRLSVTHEHHGA